jgi:hypothetical protein
MLTKPTTDQILVGIARDLREQVLPFVDDEPAKVAMGMIDQILRNLSVRVEHEVAWMHDEVADIAAAAGRVAGAPATLHLHDVVVWYGAASRWLSEGIEAAYASGDQDQINKWRSLIEARSAHEQAIMGSLDLVGRG